MPANIRLVFVVMGMAIIGCVLMFFISVAHGHSFYDPFCCDGKDCHEIPTEAVGFAPGSYVLTIRPGDHPSVTKPHTFVVPASQVRYSPDGQYHLCLWPNEDTVRCFYIPPMGS